MTRRFVLSDSGPPTGAPAYAQDLNEAQWEVVRILEGPVLVVAGAGTGKTRTLAYRVAYLVERGVPPETIVLLTFTRRAARQMLDRAASLLDSRCRSVQGGTFHSFAYSWLRRYAAALGYGAGFSVLDEADAEALFDLLRRQRLWTEAQRRMPGKETLRVLWSAVRNRNRPLSDLLAELYPQFADLESELSALFKDYETHKRIHHLLDYDDLLMRFRDLLREHAAIGRQISASCRYIMVDEYQDTNPLQAELVELLGSPHGNVMAVGDDAQAIYGFRGATVENMLRFPERFPGTRILRLEENYRSTQPILNLANYVLQGIGRRFDKRLYSRRREGLPPALVAAPDSRWEAEFVAQMVLQQRERGLRLDEMAVLFRSGRDSYELELELARRRIPYRKFGGRKLLEAAHIKDVLAHLRLAQNGQDVISWNRVLSLIDGIGPRTIRDVLAWLETAENPYALERFFTTPRYRERLRDLLRLLAFLREPDHRTAEYVEAVLSYYRPLMRRRYYEDFPHRERDLDHFLRLAESAPSLEAFLEELTLEPLSASEIGTLPADSEEPPLVLSTIHSAKGLEWHTVFLIQCLDGVLPSAHAVDDPEELDEERRLFYVALTRAREELYISYPIVHHRRGDTLVLANPSRFLQDIPETLLEPMILERAPDAEEHRRGLPPGRSETELP